MKVIECVVGVGLLVVDEIFVDNFDVVFCFVRLLGYYVNCSIFVGFCVFNNLVIVVKYV